MPTTLKPTHKAILTYYDSHKDLTHQNVSHEMGRRGPFQQLLTETAKLCDWTLVPEDAFKTSPSSPGKGATLRPDATLRDKNTLPSGFWEATAFRFPRPPCIVNAVLWTRV